MSAAMGGKDIWVVCETSLGATTAPGAAPYAAPCATEEIGGAARRGAVLASSLELVGEAAMLARSADSPREVVALVCAQVHILAANATAGGGPRPGPGTGPGTGTDIVDELAACGADRIVVLELSRAAGSDSRRERRAGFGRDSGAERGAELGAELGSPCDPVRGAEGGAERGAPGGAQRGPEYLEDSAFARAIATVAAREKPDIILMAATVFGRSVMPRLAARLRTGLTADCTALRLEEDGTLVQTRPAYGANLLAEVVCGGARPQMATVRPGVFGRPQPQAGRTAQIVRTRAELADEGADDPMAESTAGIGTEGLAVKRGEKSAEAVSPPGDGAFPLLRLLRRDFDADSGSDLSTARVVVAGGKGVGSKGGFARLERLAAILKGAVGASRSAVEAGYASYPMQVGQTGRTIRPEIYIACGISGSIQHLAGMSGSGYVIAINADRSAPIFDHADYGIVGDLGVIVDAMIEILEKGAKGD